MTDDRYSRLMRYSGFAATIDSWQNSSVVVVGLGGLGSGLVQLLSRLGVSRLVLIDRDVVARENLGHQMLYTEEDARAGLPKAVAAGRMARSINPDVDVVVHAAELNRTTIADLLGAADLIFDGLDSYFVRMIVNDFAVREGRPWFYAGVVRGELSAKAILPGQTACLQCLMPELPETGEVLTCATAGVFAPLLGVANAIQLDMANRWLAGDNLPDELVSLRLPGWDWRTTVTEGLFGRCPACSLQSFGYLDGTHDHQAAAGCHGGRYSLQLPGGDIDLAQMAKKLERAATDEVVLNQFCVSLVLDGVRYTLFPDGRLLAEGVQSEQELNSFAAKYLGL